MAKLTWKVLNLTQASNDITDHIQSLSLTVGRPTALSPFSGNSATITMFSYGGTESLVDINDEIRLRVNGGAADRTVFQGRIASRNFDDQPGLALNSTMQVLINDVMLQAGMANLQDQVLSSASNQINEIDGLLPQIQISGGATSVDTATGTFTTNANQRINEIVSGDRGILINTSGITAYQTPVTFDSFVTTTVSIGPTASATQLAYQDLTRIESASSACSTPKQPLAVQRQLRPTQTQTPAPHTAYGHLQPRQRKANLCQKPPNGTPTPFLNPKKSCWT